MASTSETQERLMSPLAIRFAQAHIRASCRHGGHVDALVAELEVCPGAGDYDLVLRAPFPALEVVRWSASRRCQARPGEPEDDHWLALDSRRLYCLQRAAVSHWPQRVAIVVEILGDVDAGQMRRKLDSVNCAQSVGIMGSSDGEQRSRWDWRQAVRQRTVNTKAARSAAERSALQQILADDEQMDASALAEVPSRLCQVRRSEGKGCSTEPSTRCGASDLDPDADPSDAVENVSGSEDGPPGRYWVSDAAENLSGSEDDAGALPAPPGLGPVPLKPPGSSGRGDCDGQADGLSLDDAPPGLAQGTSTATSETRDAGTSDGTNGTPSLSSQSTPPAKPIGATLAELAQVSFTAPTLENLPGTWRADAQKPRSKRDKCLSPGGQPQPSPTVPQAPAQCAPSSGGSGASFVLKMALCGSWEGPKGETYKIEYRGADYWSCWREGVCTTKRCTVVYDQEADRIWMGFAKTHYIDPAEVVARPDQLVWHTADGETRSSTWYKVDKDGQDGGVDVGHVERRASKKRPTGGPPGIWGPRHGDGPGPLPYGVYGGPHVAAGPRWPYPPPMPWDPYWGTPSAWGGHGGPPPPHWVAAADYGVEWAKRSSQWAAAAGRARLEPWHSGEYPWDQPW